MKTIDDIGVTFVNTVISRGVFNGNVNLTFGTALFSPVEDTRTQDLAIDTDIVVSARLRMDIECAKELHATLGRLLVAIDQLAIDQAMGEDPLTPVAEGKPN